MKKYFKILGLSENASYEEIKSARIQLLKKYHPDLYAGNKKIAEMKTIEINQAFEILSRHFENNKIRNENSRINSNGNQFQDDKQEKEIKIKSEKIVKAESSLKDTRIKDEAEDKTCRDEKGKKTLDILIYVLIAIAICLLIVVIAT